MAPEVLAREVYNEKCDVWSVGVILYILLTGVPPFHGESDQELINMVQTRQADEQPLIEKGISAEARDLIRLLLRKNPHERSSAEEAIRHGWFRKRKGHAPDLG